MAPAHFPRHIPEGHASRVSFLTLGLAQPANPSSLTAGSRLDQKISHGVELLQGLSSSPRDTAQRIFSDLELDSGLLREPRIEPIEQCAAARQVDSGIANIGGELGWDVGKRLTYAADDLLYRQGQS